jgi:hypothetical protein
MSDDLEAMDGLCAKIIAQRDRIWELEKALRLAHEWLDPTEMPEADYCIIRAALAQEQDK